MIKKIDISKFGSFKEFTWETFLNEKKFTQRNVFYGRNYAGKTTLSRVFRSLEKGKLHEDFQDANFRVYMESGETLNESKIGEELINIRVYNSDFKRENLSILYSEEGDVKPFAIIGERNIEKEKKIKVNNKKISKLKGKLGNIKDKTGLEGELNAIEVQKRTVRNLITKNLRDKAGDIRGDANLFIRTDTKRSYNRTDFLDEIDRAKESETLSEDEKEKYLSVLKEEPKAVIQFQMPNINVFINLKKEVRELLAKEIKPSNSIEYLIKDSNLQKWVEHGMKLHRNKRDTCAFCNSEINKEVWQKLDDHFTKESEEYKEKLNLLKDRIEKEIASWTDTIFIDKENFYVAYHDDYTKLNNDWKELKKNYIHNLNVLQEDIRKRLKDLFTGNQISKERLIEVDENNELTKEIKGLIEKNDNYTGILGDEQENARLNLRLNFIKKAIKDINYDEIRKEIKNLESDINKKEDEIKDVRKQIEIAETQIEMLVSQLNNQKAAVDQVNHYLQNHLSHPELELVAEEILNEQKGHTLSDNQYQFNIMRNGKPANNLSEGEESLIAFCYFLATLKQIESPENWIIFIDDPISSLDGNNLFYIFSLIDSEIAQVKYKQFFLSTHNLDLLKYTFRFEKPTNSKTLWIKEQFIIEKGKNGSSISEMPKYLSKYATEFNFLFEQIFKVATEEQNDDNFHVFYNFPNNARKFLESYLFFKYPNTFIGNDRRIKKFFNDTTDITFLQRINNEYSHGDGQPDRLHKPVDIHEFKKDALLIINKIRNSDLDQFNNLCKSIGGNEELVIELLKQREPILL